VAAAVEQTAAGRNNMGELFTPTHLIVIAVVVLVLRDGLKGVTDDINKPGDSAHTTTPKPEESTK